MNVESDLVDDRSTLAYNANTLEDATSNTNLTNLTNRRPQTKRGIIRQAYAAKTTEASSSMAAVSEEAALVKAKALIVFLSLVTVIVLIFEILVVLLFKRTGDTGWLFWLQLPSLGIVLIITFISVFSEYGALNTILLILHSLQLIATTFSLIWRVRYLGICLFAIFENPDTPIANEECSMFLIRDILFLVIIIILLFLNLMTLFSLTIAALEYTRKKEVANLIQKNQLRYSTDNQQYQQLIQEQISPQPQE
jgi:hypothetical protein